MSTDTSRRIEQLRAEAQLKHERMRADVSPNKYKEADKVPDSFFSSSPLPTPDISSHLMELSGDVQAPALIVEVSDKEMYKPTLKEKLQQKIQQEKDKAAPAPATRARARTPAAKKKAEDNMIVTVLPTVLISFVTMYSRQLLPEEYKQCAPSSEEVSGVIAPLMEVIGRRVEVHGQASEDVLCVVNSLLCATMYGIRAYIMFKDIKRGKEHNNAKDQSGGKAHTNSAGTSTGNVVGNGLRDYQGTSYQPTGTSGHGPRSTAYAVRAADDAEYGRAFVEDDNEQGSRTEGEIVADMFSRDKQGRTKLGLLRSAI